MTGAEDEAQTGADENPVKDIGGLRVPEKRAVQRPNQPADQNNDEDGLYFKLCQVAQLHT